LREHKPWTKRFPAEGLSAIATAFHAAAAMQQSMGWLTEGAD
jgi:hypothetical protein